MAQQANINRDKGTPKSDPRKLNPYAKKEKPRKATPQDIERLFGRDWQKHV